jgi:hypothetical protein
MKPYRPPRDREDALTHHDFREAARQCDTAAGALRAIADALEVGDDTRFWAAVNAAPGAMTGLGATMIALSLRLTALVNRWKAGEL